MAKQKGRRSGKKRSQNKILDAFQIAERSSKGKNEYSLEEDGDELQVRDGVMDARRFMKNQQDDDDSDLEDEELDSDEALGSDDDFDVLNSTMSQTIRDKNKRRKRGEESESESEDEAYDSIDESQLVTLSEAWDLDDKDLGLTKGPASSKTKDVIFDDDRESESESESQSGSEGDSESESESDSESESESEDEEQMLRGSDDDEVDLTTTTSKIKSQVKNPETRKRLISETTDENEFSVPTRGRKLTLAEMMAGTDASDAPLIDQEEEELKPLAVPLPKRIQQRHDRKAAYEITKEEVSKWQDTVRAIQEADHLQFPLAPADQEEQDEIDAEAEYEALQFIPEAHATTELESKINGLLTAGALLDESKEATFEQMQSAKLSKDELFKRTQELRRMRELMFRDEQRAKRIKKIKSKQFHKIRKRERLRDAELVEGSDESDAEDHDMKRAEERMSLRHKTQSKWAKSMIKSGITKDASTRAELEEMLRQGERLRAKQLGYEEGEQSDDGVSDIEREYDNDNAEAEELERGKLGKGVLAMDFMKTAEERKRKENLKEIEFLKSMREDGKADFADSESNSINQLKNQGRRVYAPSVAAEKQEMEEFEEEILQDFRDEEAKSLENRMRSRDREQVEDEEDQPPAKKHKIEEREEEEFKGFDDESDGSGSNDDEDAEAENPWLMASDEPTEKSKKFNVITEDSSRLSKAANKIQKHANKKSSSKSKGPTSLIDMDAILEMEGDVYGSDNEDSGTSRMFRQQNLIKEAFAGDDVTSEFNEEKARIADEEDDKEEDLTLPGWGDWAGSDKPQKPKKKFVLKIDGVAQKDKRRDKNLKNVIVNETVNKHNLKYQSSSVPFPYESKEQYERALRMPIGEEWTSRVTHQKATLPRVIVKQGMVINPLQAPFK